MANILGIDADWEIVTYYGRGFRDKFIFNNFATLWPKHKIDRFNGQDAVSANIDNYMSNNAVHYITGMGHGLYDSFTGYQNQSIWNANQNLGHLQGTIVHLLSCQTGALLGRSLTSQGAHAFWGYTVNFTFYHSDPPPQDLSQDKTAEPFLKMDCIIDRGILGRKAANEIYDSITQYVAQIYPQLPSYQRAVFLDNYLHLVCPATNWGSPNAVII
jgi:hypothetical protein